MPAALIYLSLYAIWTLGFPQVLESSGFLKARKVLKKEST